jgi:hypothetical protein
MVIFGLIEEVGSGHACMNHDVGVGCRLWCSRVEDAVVVFALVVHGGMEVAAVEACREDSRL